jgi:hypothetical protein
LLTLRAIRLGVIDRPIAVTAQTDGGEVEVRAGDSTRL